MLQEERIERFENIVGSRPYSYRHGQRLPDELIQHREHLVGAPVAELVMNKVDSPDVVQMCGPQLVDQAILVVKPTALLVALRKLQPFLATESLDLLVIDPPTFESKQLGDLAILEKRTGPVPLMLNMHPFSENRCGSRFCKAKSTKALTYRSG